MTGGRAQARRGEGRRSEGHRPDGGRAEGRRSAQPQKSSGGTPALLALGLPLVGALVDEVVNSSLGVIFAVLTVVGTAGAAMLSRRSGWWWVLPAPPPVVLGYTAAAELLANSEKYKGSKALAVGAGKWAIHGFPVMAAAMMAALIVILVRVARERGSRRG